MSALISIRGELLNPAAEYEQEEGHMAVALDHHRRVPAKQKKKVTWEYRLIFLLSFCLFLVAAIVERMMPHKWMGQTAKSHKSVFVEAKEAASTSVPFAFMG